MSYRLLPALWCVFAGLTVATAHAAPVRGHDVEARAEAASPGEVAVEEPNVEDLVLSAMKTPTTVQEAPAIVTVVTGDQVREQGFRTLGDAIGMVPGFLTYGYGYGVVRSPIARGTLFGALFLQDGVDMYDPIGFVLLPSLYPIETLQRMEVTSGPGGVLWGANSFVGVVNIISKTADDLDGLEAHASYGSSTAGRRDAINTYVMGGTKLFDGKLKLFAHVGYRNWHEGGLFLPLRVIVGDLRDGSVGVYEPSYTASAGHSQEINVAGNAQLGDFSLHWSLPYTRQQFAVGLLGVAASQHLGEDNLDCDDPANAAICAQRIDPDRLARKTVYAVGNRLAILRYHPTLASERVRVDARAFFAQYEIAYKPTVMVPPNALLGTGVTMEMDYTTYRGGASLDVDLALPWKSRLLVGGELFYDYLPLDHLRILANPGFFASGTFNGRPCPPAQGDSICPLVTHNQSDRLTSGLFASAETRLVPQVALNAATRVQLYGGKRSLSPVVLFSGAAVWSFLPSWNLKVSFTEGFRPPSLLKTDNGDFTWLPNPDLKVERSRAVQAELNVRLLDNEGPIRQLALRADYAYTWLDDFIILAQGGFRNVSRIGSHTAELLARLSLKAGHGLSLGYTFLRAATDDQGVLRSQPNQWLTLQGTFNVWRQRLVATTNLVATGSFEDPNVNPALNATTYLGRVAEGQLQQDPIRLATFTDRVLDRVGPTVLWNAGLRYLVPSWRLRLTADVYNLLDNRTHDPEGFYDLAVSADPVPNPVRGLAAIAGADVAF